MNKIFALTLVVFMMLQSVVLAYNPYTKPLKNKLVTTKQITLNDITIIRNEYVPKTKLKRQCKCFEYLITNNTDETIVLEKVLSTDLLSLNQSAGRALIPTFWDFIPVVNIFVAIPVDLEKNRFTRPLPYDEDIDAKETLRILVMTDKILPNVEFYFKINDKEEVIKLNGDMEYEKI